MRSSLMVAAFAAGAFAVPYVKRDIVTDTAIDMVYVTDIITVTAGSEPAATDIAASDESSHKHFGHHKWGGFGSADSSTTEAAAQPTSTAVFVAPTTAPAPAPATTQAPSPQSPPSQAPSPEAPATNSPAAPAPVAPASQPTSYSDIVLFHHNIHRANHSAPDIEWDDDLAHSAADIAATCFYAHNTAMDGGGYGQNIAAGIEPNNVSSVITDLFYNGEVGWYNGLYGQPQPDMSNFDHWGHFSQIVWKATTHVGCATQDCSSQGLGNVGLDVPPFFTVCNYRSPGNFANDYGANIGSPLGHPTAQWNAGL